MAKGVKSSISSFDRVSATIAALTIVGLAVFLLIRNEPISDDQLFFVLRVVISFSVAVLGATIPGFLDVKWSGSGLAIRAGGALALFVLTLVYTPNLVKDDDQAIIRQRSTGDHSPPIANNTGTIVIQSPQQSGK